MKKITLIASLILGSFCAFSQTTKQEGPLRMTKHQADSLNAVTVRQFNESGPSAVIWYVYEGQTEKPPMPPMLMMPVKVELVKEEEKQ